jgi:ribosome-associated toxin RatA of RatAB toxin-antitoxin module
MSETENRIVIRGDPDRVFALAAAVEGWPEFLPHYRWVRVLAAPDGPLAEENADAESEGSLSEGRARVVEMAARRGILPVRWIARQWRNPAARRICFRHIGGLSRGMAVEWRIDPCREGTQVVIWHGLSLELPLVGSRLGAWIVGEQFVRVIAGRTLACLKERVESEAAVQD